MYCTGGVRCELASSYLRSKGKDFEDVMQLSGGIHRYLEDFTDGGYFKGKNFVFDHRMAVASSSEEIVGRCLLCKAPFDDYFARNRCSLCRLLVLICPTCQGAGNSPASSAKYVCELCEVNQKAFGGSETGEVYSIKSGAPITKAMTSPTDLKTSLLHGLATKRKLRLLCLHGFRQNASCFQGRLGSLKKKLKHIADFVFVDAPHSLPFIQQERTEDWSDVGPKRDLKRAFCQKPTRKNAWLISPGDARAMKEEESGVEGERRNTRFEPWQYETQTEGWEKSWECLQRVFQDLGPFDGVLGFSQGAAVVAALCSLRHTRPLNNDVIDAAVHFRFAVLCSGYSSPVPLHAKITSSEAGIRCPSLHIYGGQDRQIGSEMSEQLASLFHRDDRVIIKHDYGHIIPTKPEYIEQYVHFLRGFLE